SSRRRHTRFSRDWSSDVCSSDLVDTAVAGHLPGAEYLAGVALGSLFFNLLFWVFGFLRMGTTGMVAQYAGAHNPMAVLLTVGRGDRKSVVEGNRRDGRGRGCVEK